MRKIYSLMLIAAGLLIGTSLQAAVHNVGTEDQLRTAFANAVDGDKIVLSQHIQVAAPIIFQRETKGTKVTLDMNGFNISTTTADRILGVRCGELTITGKGHIDASLKKGGIMVCGSAKPIIENNQPAVFTKLVIEKDVKVSGESRGVDIYTYDDAIFGAIDQANNPRLFHAHAGSHGVAENVFIEVYGELYGGEYGLQVSGTVRYPKADAVYNTSDAVKTAHGGSSPITADNEADYQLCTPKVHVYPSAVCWGANEYNDGTEDKPLWHYGTGIYAGGYAEISVEGQCYGANGVYIKDSKVEFNNAVVYSTYDKSAVETSATTSGIVSAGSGVVVESNSSYVGLTRVDIKGDTKISGSTGYGIEQTITNGKKEQLEVLSIEGGTIESGDKGGIIVASVNTGEIEVSAGTIPGQTIKVKETDCDENCETEKPISEFIPKEGDEPKSHMIFIYDKAGEIFATVVIPGPAPTLIECGSFNINNCTSASAVDFAECEESQTLSKNVEVKEIVMNSADKDQKITIPDGTTLTVDYLVLGGHANITVEPGGKLIVKGNLGVKNVDASNIVLKTQEGKVAQFLFHPDVISNRNPYATIEYISKSYRNSAEDRCSQYCGMPMLNGNVDKITVAQIDLSTSNEVPVTYNTAIDVWRGQEWDRIGVITGDDVSGLSMSKFNVPFGFYGLLSSNPQSANVNMKYSFEGKLVGNMNPTIKVLKEWNTLSNAYTGIIPAPQVTNLLTSYASVGIECSVWLYKQNGDALSWESSNELRPIGNLDPMAPMMIKNNGNVTNIELNYASLVWNPAMGNASAPARRISNDMSKATIRVNGNGMTNIVTLAESAQFTTGYDNGFDAEKYMGEKMNLYVTDEKPMDIFATDNINNTYVGFEVEKAGTYTLSFEDLQGQTMTLVDLVNGNQIDMVEGATYDFEAEANEANDYRFQVIRHNTATNLQNAHVGANVMKTMQNGRLMIIKNGRCFDAMGVNVK